MNANSKAISKILDDVARNFPKGLKAIFVPFPPGPPTFEGSAERCVHKGTYMLTSDYEKLEAENKKLKADNAYLSNRVLELTRAFYSLEYNPRPF